MSTIGIAIIGCGGISLQNHLPGLALCADTKVTALCDTNAATLDAASKATGVAAIFTNYEDIVKRDDVQAVIIATPNVAHAPIALAAIAAGKHVLCEKPIAMSYAEAKQMADAADAAGVRHMTAFTYRFVPAMRYLGHLIAQGDLGAAVSLSVVPVAGLGDAEPRVASGEETRGHGRTRGHAFASHRLCAASRRDR